MKCIVVGVDMVAHEGMSKLWMYSWRATKKYIRSILGPRDP